MSCRVSPMEYGGSFHINTRGSGVYFCIDCGHFCRYCGKQRSKKLGKWVCCRCGNSGERCTDCAYREMFE